MICYIFGAGEMTPCDIRPKKEDIMIAADGGYDYLKKLQISPDIIIGDFAISHRNNAFATLPKKMIPI